jgi:hypothetical protein
MALDHHDLKSIVDCRPTEHVFTARWHDERPL